MSAPSTSRSQPGTRRSTTRCSARPSTCHSPPPRPSPPPQAPPALQAGFGELAEAIRPHAAGDDLGLLTETFWAALHGLVTLTRGGRLPAEQQDRRLALLLAHFTDQR